MQKRSVVAAITGVAIFATAAFAAVTFDPATGQGFVGKGDVQLVYGWSNKQLNDNANTLAFRAVGEQVTEVSWECTRVTNRGEEVVTERERTTTTSYAGVLSATARDNKKQITGFILTGYASAPTGTSTTDGPQVNSCPGSATLTSPAGAPVEISNTGGVQVSNNGVDFTDLQ